MLSQCNLALQDAETDGEIVKVNTAAATPVAPVEEQEFLHKVLKWDDLWVYLNPGVVSEQPYLPAVAPILVCGAFVFGTLLTTLFFPSSKHLT